MTSELITETPETEYIKPEDRIYQVALDKDKLDWKNFLYQLIYSEGLDPWNIDLSVLTQKYLEAMKNLDRVDFEVSGKFLTIAVFLLKTKAENLVDKDLRGIDEKIAWAQQTDDMDIGIDSLEELDSHLDELTQEEFVKKKEKYAIRVRNPIARKRKVNIFDLIKTLEKTFEQSNKRRANFFARNPDVEYNGPQFEKKPMDLKQIISELYEIIMDEMKNKKGHVTFGHISKGANHKMAILEKFIPLLHLHNQDKVELKQESHFSEIQIHKPRSE
jgi:chromatin segregation and condensation protein Rec8/ScpA/Scc1 (kleisin family)